MSKIIFIREGRNLSYDVIRPNFETASFEVDIDFGIKTNRVIPFGLPKKVTYCDTDHIDLLHKPNLKFKQDFFKEIHQSLLRSISKEVDVDAKEDLVVLISFNFSPVVERLNPFSWNKLYTLEYMYMISINFPVDMNKMKAR